MDAEPLLSEVARCLNEAHLEAVLIGNAAAALQGAPVTTVDFDFLFRKTPRNLSKMKAVATALGATILRPYYPVSDLYRMVRDDDGLQVDLMATVHGIRSFAGLRDRAVRVDIGGAPLLVASLADVIRSNAPRSTPETSPCSMSGRGPLKEPISRRARLAALARESDRALEELIERWQKRPMHRRTNFLRKRIGPGRTAL